jgi:uncharacterized protein involved in exopolysaccharide biosynthesis
LKASRGNSWPPRIGSADDTEILEVSYRDPNPVRGRRLATEFAEAYLQFREDATSKLIPEQAKDLEGRSRPSSSG